MIKQVLKKLLTAAVIAGSLLSVGVGQIYASDTTDKYFNFTFEGGFGNSYAQTEYRAKYDTSSVYKKIGTWSNSGESYNAWVMINSSVAVSSSYYFDEDKVNVPTYMINYAVEKYGSPISIKILGEMSSNWNPCVVTGVWSPDSVGGP